MASTTMGVKLDEATRDRIKSAAQRIDRTPHWLIKQAIFNYLEGWKVTVNCQNWQQQVHSLCKTQKMLYRNSLKTLISHS